MFLSARRVLSGAMHGVSLSGSMGIAWKAYEKQLQHRPVITQATTSAMLWGLGDMLAQQVEQCKSLDLRRAALTAGFGAAIVGPLGHYWYLGLDSIAARHFARGSRAFFASKVVADTALFGPGFVTAFYAYGCGVMDGTGLDGFLKKMRVDFLPTFLAELAFWPLFQTWNFTQVPVRHQLLAMNLVTLADATFLSWTRNQEDWFGTLLATVTGKPAPVAAVADAAK